VTEKTGFRRISEASVQDRTGRGWQEWFGILDAWEAWQKGHTASARYLSETYHLSPWWAQAVTIRYEYERGLAGGKT
jgi:hypothetical protein